MATGKGRNEKWFVFNFHIQANTHTYRQETEAERQKRQTNRQTVILLESGKGMERD